jgi:hypothetical protein
MIPVRSNRVPRNTNTITENTRGFAAAATNDSHATEGAAHPAKAHKMTNATTIASPTVRLSTAMRTMTLTR